MQAAVSRKRIRATLHRAIEEEFDRAWASYVQRVRDVANMHSGEADLQRALSSAGLLEGPDMEDIAGPMVEKAYRAALQDGRKNQDLSERNNDGVAAS